MSNVDQKSISIADIAREAGVSKSTVSRALSGKGRIGSVTRQKILHLAQNHGYVSPWNNGMANRTNNIAVVIPQDADSGDIPFFQNCMLRISERLSHHGYDAVLVVQKNNDISPLMRVVSSKKVDGVILTRIEEKDESVNFLIESGIPFVVMGTSTQDICQIDSDQTAGCYEMTKFMIGKGCKSVGVLGGSKNYLVNVYRYEGFTSAWKDAGLDESDYSVYWDLDDRDRVAEILPGLMKENPQCLVCLDDEVCVHVLKWLAQNEYEVPQDIQVISFYDNVVLENHMPPVTALEVDVAELGSRIADLAVGRTEGRAVPLLSRINYKIKIRESFR